MMEATRQATFSSAVALLLIVPTRQWWAYVLAALRH